MSLQVLFRPAATDEFTDATEWYDKKRSGLGEEFIREIEEAIARAVAAPQHCPVVFGDVRRSVARRFPFCVYFRVRANALVVLAVFHGRRDPTVWQRR